MSEINGTENARRLDHPQCVHGAARCNKAAQIRERALAARSARGTPECGPTTPAASLLRRLGSASFIEKGSSSPESICSCMSNHSESTRSVVLCLLVFIFM